MTSIYSGIAGDEGMAKVSRYLQGSWMRRAPTKTMLVVSIVVECR